MNGESLNTLDKKVEHEKLVERIYQSALADHEEYVAFPPEQIRKTIDSCLSEMEALEAAAGSKNALRALTLEIAQNVVAIWDFSGSGNYDKPRGDDPYKDLNWAAGTDHDRLNYSAWLARKMAQLRDPNGASGSAKESISKFGPTIIYNANETMNAVARDVLTRKGIIIPQEKVIIPEKGRENTVEQIKDFSLPAGLHQSGKEIGMVSHAPHLVRIAHILNKYQPVPSDMHIRMFPMRPPGTARDREQYVTMEIRGILYYTYLSKLQHATEDTCDYIIHGKETPQHTTP